MSFRITGLAAAPFRHLYGRSDADLAARGVKRFVAEATSRFPDRIELRDAAAGEAVLLLNHTHQPADTPFRASHAIFVREGADTAWNAVDTVPPALQTRMLSLRAFDADHMIHAAEVVQGDVAATLIARMLDDPAVSYIQAHYAAYGCYAARIERATGNASAV